MKLLRTKYIFALLIGVLLVALSAKIVFAQGGTGAQGGIFGDYEVQPGKMVEVPVEVRNVADLYAVDVEIQFDPTIVQVQDANPDAEGVQPALGMFLDAGLTLFNTVDNEAGVVRFVMTQVNPSEAKSGSGIVLVLYLQGVSDGTSDLTLTTFELSTRAGEAIPMEAIDGTITVTGDASESDSTAIPVQDQEMMVPIPTAIPTPTLTEGAEEALPPVQSTPDEQVDQAGKAASSEAQAETKATAVENASEDPGFLLLDYWWVVLIVVVIVIGFGIYLWVTRK
jgi:hypothetical protein